MVAVLCMSEAILLDYDAIRKTKVNTTKVFSIELFYSRLLRLPNGLNLVTKRLELDRAHMLDAYAHAFSMLTDM